MADLVADVTTSDLPFTDGVVLEQSVSWRRPHLAFIRVLYTTSRGYVVWTVNLQDLERERARGNHGGFGNGNYFSDPADPFADEASAVEYQRRVTDG